MISIGESTFFTDLTGDGFLEVDLMGEATFYGFSTLTGLGFFMGVGLAGVCLAGVGLAVICLAGVFLTDFLADLTSDF
jgi:hypothetical protein